MAMIPRPTKIVCVGRNYAKHAQELGNKVPERPLLFFKPPSSLIADGDPILLPRASQQVEHEAEIGVVIGKLLRRADRAAARDAIAGITCVNDVTARDLQRSDGQWTRAKGFDTFCPAGPGVVPLAELPPLEELEVIGRVNGNERQHGHARDMAFDIVTILVYISGIMTRRCLGWGSCRTPLSLKPDRAGRVWPPPPPPLAAPQRAINRRYGRVPTVGERRLQSGARTGTRS